MTDLHHDMAILKAIGNRHWNVALDLIKKRKGQSLMNEIGLSPLHLCLECNPPVNVVRKLLACGADDVNRKFKKTGATPLATALVENQSLELVQLLLEAGASANEPRNDGLTPLHIAVLAKAPVRMLKALKHAGANHMVTNKQGLTPFHTAVLVSADVKVIEWFIKDLHCDPNSILGEEFERELSLSVAQHNASSRIDELLIKSGEIIYGENGFTPLHAAVSVVKISPGLVRLLIEAGGNPNAQLKDGATPMLLAAQTNAPVAIMKLLLDAGGDVTIPNRNQYLPVYIAAMVNVDPEVMRLIIRAGGDVNQMQDGPGRQHSALHAAIVENCSPALLSVMLSDGHGDPNLVCPKGYTPIHTGLLSTPMMSIDNLALLIEAGADVNSIPKGIENRDTPLSMAVKRGANPSLIEMLVLSGATLNNRELPLLRLAIQATASKDVIGTLIACGADLYEGGENLSDYARQHGRKDLEELLNRPEDFMTCAGCHQHAPNLGTCAGCNVMFYCDRQCQKAHWTRTHKHCCKMYKRTGLSS